MSLTKYIPNTITSMNALSGTIGVVFALQGHPEYGFICMLAAAVFDFCDGLAARLLGAYSPMGKELDSLADMVSFGVLPSVMLIGTMQLKGVDSWTEVVPVFLAVMSALRLAKFNVDERQSTDFIGVATPTAAMICGSLCYFSLHSKLLDSLVGSLWFLPAVAVVLGLLLVSEIPMFGMKVAKGHRLLDAKRIVFLCAIVLIIACTAAFRLNWSLAVLGVFVFYILENLVLRVLPGPRL
ncbi:MAG: CDP-diacylglycerol--serine O-phosphatidyltransferase [Bacteroidales bacterium]|nr:CDP-diacylglycerol--serine O-phosphatidyltransferase [Bacteroidales bacterium]